MSKTVAVAELAAHLDEVLEQVQETKEGSTHHEGRQAARARGAGPATSSLIVADTQGVPSIVLLEVAMLAERGRVKLPRDAEEWLSDLLELPNVELLPINIRIAVTAARLRNTIHDPADQLVVATVLHHGEPLVTKDGRIRAANVVETIW